MAVSTKIVVEVPETKTVMVEKTVYVMELSEDEACAFLALADNTGGCPRESGRKHIDSMRLALRGYPELDGGRFPLHREPGFSFARSR